MPSLSPSPVRPSINQRNSSTQSLSTTGKTAHKLPRPYVVGGRPGHARNVSHGKGLSKLGKINSTTNLAAEATRTHQRKKSAPSPSTSPHVSAIKRNNSHVVLAKNTSHANLRKNLSANALPRNISHTTLKKIGLAPPLKRKNSDDHQRQEIFNLGDQSSEGEDEEGEWEDSTNQSPELTRSNTRDNSKTSTPIRAVTPAEDLAQKPADKSPLHEGRTSSPPQPSPYHRNRSLPDLTQQSQERERLPDPVLLQPGARVSKAPPAMSTVSALANTPNSSRKDSSRPFEKVSQNDADSSLTHVSTPGGGKSSSTEAGVSHFLSTSIPGRSRDSGSNDEGTASKFLSNYHPLPSEPDTARPGKTATPGHLPSRTQQRLELQRREAMRPAGSVDSSTPPATSALGNLGYTFSSSSLHSRSGSRGRSRASLGAAASASGNIDAKAMRREYEAAVKQHSVVSRFRNPVVESLNRLKANGVLPKDKGVTGAAAAGAAGRRPQSRRGFPSGINGTTQESGALNPTLAQSGRGQRVQFGHSSSARGKQRANMGSSDDLAAFETSRPASSGAGSEDSERDDDGRVHIRGGDEGSRERVLSREEAMLRRLWESRDVFDRPPSRMGNRGSGIMVGGGMEGRDD